MSRHGKNCRLKARKNARIRKRWLQEYRVRGSGTRRWNCPSARSILIRRAENYKLYGNAQQYMKKSRRK